MTQETTAPETNNQKEIDLLDLLRQVWAARKRIVKYAVIGGVAGLIIGFSIPKSYVTTIKLAPESKNGAQGGGGMAGLAAMAGINLAQGGANDGITTAIFPEIVRSTPFLLEFAEIPVTLSAPKGETGPRMSLFDYVTEHQKRAWWKYITAFPGKAIGWVTSIGRDREEEAVPPLDSVNLFFLPGPYRGFVGSLDQMLRVEEDKKSSMLEVKVTMQDPLVAAVVADSLVTKLQRYMTTYRTQKTRNDLEQNIRQNAEAKLRYYEAEDRLVAAVDQNRTISSEALRTRIERLRNEREIAYNVYNQTASQVEVTKIKLQEETPIATVVEPAIVSDRPASPNKMLILVGFAFLGGFIAVGSVVVKSLLLPSSETASDTPEVGEA